MLRKHPTLYLPIARRRRKASPVTADTDLVIEGFPRSGNTFAITAFGSAQTRQVRVAHHEHAAAQVLGAVRLGIPALVLIREPEEAVLSFAIQQPHITLRQALRSYVRFYEPLLPHRDRLVVATFGQVTRDFGEVMRLLNAAFETDFGVFEHTEENARACLAAIEEHGRTRRGEGPLLHRKGSFPSEVRAALKDALREEYLSDRLRRPRTRAERAFERMTGAA